MRSEDGSGPEREPTEIGDDVPEADAIEQQQPMVPEAVDDRPEAIPPDAAEADALDQARAVPPDDDLDRGR